jgi:SAM-dependent methyltransferase
MTEKFRLCPTCWICGSDQRRTLLESVLNFREYKTKAPELASYSGEAFSLVRCLDCGFAQVDRLPTYASFFADMYNQHWSEEWVKEEFKSSYRDAIFRRVLTKLANEGAEPGRLLDVGAHVGRFVYLARAAGWEARGIEPNARTAALAREHLGLPVQHGTWQTLTEDGTYRVITFLDVLEHLPEPVQVLQSLVRQLEPGGRLVIKVPHGQHQWWKERLRSWGTGKVPNVANNMVHVNHFTPYSLTRALEQAGLRVVHLEPGYPELPPGQGIKAKLERGIRRVVYALASGPGGLASPWTLNLLAIGQKEDRSDQ